MTFISDKNVFSCYQAKVLMQELLINMQLQISDVECVYNGDIRAVFVERGGKCPPFRIIATITSNINATFQCHDASRVKSWLSNWNSSLGALDIYKNVNNDQVVNLTHCSEDIEKAPDHSIQGCHRVFYCSKSLSRDRTVCLVRGYFRRRVVPPEETLKLPLISNSPRNWCYVAF